MIVGLYQAVEFAKIRGQVVVMRCEYRVDKHGVEHDLLHDDEFEIHGERGNERIVASARGIEALMVEAARRKGRYVGRHPAETPKQRDASLVMPGGVLYTE